jgi:hypothetical protein
MSIFVAVTEILKVLVIKKRERQPSCFGLIGSSLSSHYTKGNWTWVRLILSFYVEFQTFDAFPIGTCEKYLTFQQAEFHLRSPGALKRIFGSILGGITLHYNFPLGSFLS